MKFGQPAQVLLLSSLYTVVDAFPLLHFDQLLTKRAPQSYSVVAVDGGQPTGVSVQTVTDRVVQTSITTILSTIVVTQSDIATTVVLTSTAAVTITQAPVTISAPAETQTLLVGGSMTSSPYDNGMWHTTYYSSWTISPSVVSSSPPSSKISSSPSIVFTSATILAGPAASTSISKADIAIAASTLAATEKTTSKSTTTSAAAASTLVTTERVTSIYATTLPLVATTPATTEKVPAGGTTTVSASAAATTTNWVTAYGQWHNHPNAEGSWWW